MNPVLNKIKKFKFNYLIILIIIILAYEYNPTTSLSCVDERGKLVDFFIGYKIPKLEQSKDDLIRNGVRYVYWTSNNQHSNHWHTSTRSINDDKSLLGLTLKPVLKNINSHNYNIIIFNDQKPTGNILLIIFHYF